MGLELILQMACDLDAGPVVVGTRAEGLTANARPATRGPQISVEYVDTSWTLDAVGWFPTRDRAYHIAPAELEDVLLEHPRAAEAAVLGVPDDERGECIAAVHWAQASRHMHRGEVAGVRARTAAWVG